MPAPSESFAPPGARRATSPRGTPADDPLVTLPPVSAAIPGPDALRSAWDDAPAAPGRAGAPRWFYGVTAACLVALTVAACVVAAAAVERLRLAPTAIAGYVVDTRLRALCSAYDCVRLSRTVVPADTALHRLHDYPAGSGPAPKP